MKSKKKKNVHSTVSKDNDLIYVYLCVLFFASEHSYVRIIVNDPRNREPIDIDTSTIYIQNEI